MHRFRGDIAIGGRADGEGGSIPPLLSPHTWRRSDSCFEDLRPPQASDVIHRLFTDRRAPPLYGRPQTPPQKPPTALASRSSRPPRRAGSAWRYSLGSRAWLLESAPKRIRVLMSIKSSFKEHRIELQESRHRETQAYRQKIQQQKQRPALKPHHIVDPRLADDLPELREVPERPAGGDGRGPLLADAGDPPERSDRKGVDLHRAGEGRH